MELRSKNAHAAPIWMELGPKIVHAAPMRVDFEGLLSNLEEEIASGSEPKKY